MAPQAADRSSQAAFAGASDSDAATRRHTQKNDIASSDPRLVACKNLLLYSDRLWPNLTTGRLLGVPYAQGRWPCIFCELRPAACELRLFHESIAAERHIRRGATWGARYALRAFRNVVVILSLSRRNAASESEERARGSWFVARTSLPLYSDGL